MYARNFLDQRNGVLLNMQILEASFEIQILEQTDL